jgi:hypothetical protein
MAGINGSSDYLQKKCAIGRNRLRISMNYQTVTELIIPGRAEAIKIIAQFADCSFFCRKFLLQL